MVNIGMIYANGKIKRRLKRFAKAHGINWKDVYTISLLVDENKATKLIVGNASFKRIGEFAFDDVFPVGWES